MGEWLAEMTKCGHPANKDASFMADAELPVAFGTGHKWKAGCLSLGLIHPESR
jgi:hypothetical protein